ncbi:MAG TPA: ceramide glucosyltransferase [Nitrospiraceae bacterium]|jgi:ceramide glucosyltransferase|nr:ceramide glucosyltransferase [Nitrospiraceae bacterium]
MAIFWIFASIAILALVGYGLQVVAIRFSLFLSPHYSREGNTLPPFFPPISILKPLKGLDDNLFDNLESFCNQDYPEYEIIFSLQHYNDPAYKVAQKIKEKYPDRNISLIVERCDDGLNPKVNNLIPAYKISRYEYVLISDSNVLVDKNYLTEIVKPMTSPQVGLVSNPIKGVGGRSIGSVLENLHMNSFVLGSVCFLDKFLKMSCVVGKSMLMRKGDLDAIGGLKACKDVLAEDYMIGKMMKEHGKEVVLSSYMVENVNHYWGTKKFINRHTRWGKLRWKIGGLKYISELLGNAVFMSSLPIVLWEPSRITISFALLVCLLKAAGDFVVGRLINSDQNPLFFFLAPVKDIIIGFLWFVPLVSNTVSWRGNRFIIGKNSALTVCSESGLWAWRYRLVDAIRERIA